MSEIAEHLDRIRALLDLGGDEVEVPAEPTADEVGALDAVSYRWPDVAASVNVYLFSGYDDADAAESELLDGTDRDLIHVVSTVNGSLLLWAMAPADDEDGKARIAGLASGFAGRE